MKLSGNVLAENYTEMLIARSQNVCKTYFFKMLNGWEGLESEEHRWAWGCGPESQKPKSQPVLYSIGKPEVKLFKGIYFHDCIVKYPKN